MIPVKSAVRNSMAFFALLIPAFDAVAQETVTPDALRQANELYDSGRYAEALPTFKLAADSPDIDGITLYRLYFCQKTVGDAESGQTLTRARVALDREVDATHGLEVAFYRSNAYTNLGLGDQVAHLAEQVTSRIESGASPEPSEPVDQFRLGKLFADQSRDADAEIWFSRAVDGFATSENPSHRTYFVWAARWIASRAAADERFEVVAKQYAHVVAAGQPTLQELDKLSLANLIIGDYDAAQQSYAQAARMQPAEAGRYTYGGGLARLASRAGELPISPDDDRGWDETSKEELEEILKGQAEAVRSIKAEAEPTTALSPTQRTAFDARLQTLQPIFVAAAVEYMRRGFNLREAAFFGGFATLVFQPREWRIPTGPRKRWTQKMIQEQRERLQAEADKKDGNDKQED